MPYLTYEDANRLELSNELLSSLIAMRLLHQQYLERPEAEPYRRELGELREKYRAIFLATQAMTTKHQKNAGGLGQSRRQTEAYLGAAMVKGFLSGILAFPWLLLQACSRMPSLQDQVIRDAQRSRYEFLIRYQDYYRRSLGGAWKLKFREFWTEWLHGPRVRDMRFCHQMMTTSYFLVPSPHRGRGLGLP